MSKYCQYVCYKKRGKYYIIPKRYAPNVAIMCIYLGLFLRKTSFFAYLCTKTIFPET